MIDDEEKVTRETAAYDRLEAVLRVTKPLCDKINPFDNNIDENSDEKKSNEDDHDEEIGQSTSTNISNRFRWNVCEVRKWKCPSSSLCLSIQRTTQWLMFLFEIDFLFQWKSIVKNEKINERAVWVSLKKNILKLLTTGWTFQLALSKQNHAEPIETVLNFWWLTIILKTKIYSKFVFSLIHLCFIYLDQLNHPEKIILKIEHADGRQLNFSLPPTTTLKNLHRQVSDSLSIPSVSLVYNNQTIKIDEENQMITLKDLEFSTNEIHLIESYPIHRKLRIYIQTSTNPSGKKKKKFHFDDW